MSPRRRVGDDAVVVGLLGFLGLSSLLLLLWLFSFVEVL